MKNRYTFAFFISLVSLSSLHALRPGQKRGPEPAQPEPTVVLQEVIAQEMPIASEPTAQDLQELSNKLDQAQGEIAKGTIVQSDPKDIAQARSFVVMARELTACYAPRMLWGKKCDEAKKERLKAELRAQLPAMDRKLLMKLGLGALALAPLIALVVAASPSEIEKINMRMLASSELKTMKKDLETAIAGLGPKEKNMLITAAFNDDINVDTISQHADRLKEPYRQKFYAAAIQVAKDLNATDEADKLTKLSQEPLVSQYVSGGQRVEIK